MAEDLNSSFEGIYPVQDAMNGYWKTQGYKDGDTRSGQGRKSSAQPATLPCEAEIGGGRPCGAEAKVRCVHYRYSARLDRRLGEMQQVLSEAIYEITCPRCGWRSQVQRIERN